MPPQSVVLRMGADVDGVKVSLKTIAKSAADADNVFKRWDKTLRKVGQTLAVQGRGTGIVTAKSKKYTISINEASNANERLARSTNQVGRTFKVVSGVFVSFNRNIVGSLSRTTLAITRAFSGVRQIGQAFLNLGITMTLFLGLPLRRAAEGAIGVLADLDEALVKVGKTVGTLSRKQIRGELEPALRAMALRVPTAVQDLADLAAVAGQLGIKSIPQILELVQVGAELASATDLTAEQSITALGRLANAWDELANQVGGPGAFARRLGNVIVRLGNDMAVFESEILDAVSDAISTAKLLGVLPQQLVALAAGLRAAGLSIEESGTAVRRAFENMLQNREILAQAAGLTVAEITKRIGEDPVGFFLDLIRAINQIEDPAKRALAGLAIFEVRGVRALTASVPDLEEALSKANQEFDDGSALTNEFQRSLTSVNAQLKILKNSINEVALTLGEAALPDLIKAIQMAAGGVQVLADRFKVLPKRTKEIILVAGALTPIFLMLFTALGSLTFAIGIFISGLFTVFSVVLSLIGALPSLISLLVALGAALLAGPVVIGERFFKVFDNIRTRVIEPLRRQVASWGESIIKSLAQGMLDGMDFVVSATEAIARAIADFFKAESPPKEGPLSKIVDWGRNLMDTYLGAFQLADFGVLRDVAGIIRDVLDAFASEGLIGKSDVIPRVLELRTEVAKLIDIFNRTGVIASDVMARITSQLGDAGDEVAKLLRLSLEYNRTQKELRDIERKREDVDRLLDKEIKAISLRNDLTAAEKLLLISRARARARDTKESLRDQERLLKTKEETQSEELDRQKALIDTYRDTTALQMEQIKLLDQISKSLRQAKGVDFSLKLGEEGARDLSKFVGVFDDTMEDVLTKISEAKKVMEAFLKGVLGEPAARLVEEFDPFTGQKEPALVPYGKQEQEAYAFGQRLRASVDAVLQPFRDLQTAIGDTANAISEFFRGEAGGGAGGLKAENTNLYSALSKVLGLATAIALVFGAPKFLAGLKAATAFTESISVMAILSKVLGVIVLAGFIGRLVERWGELNDAFTITGKQSDAITILERLHAVLDNVLTAMAGITALLGQIGVTAADGFIAVVTGDPDDVQTFNDSLVELKGNLEDVLGIVDSYKLEAGLIGWLLFGDMALASAGGLAKYLRPGGFTRLKAQIMGLLAGLSTMSLKGRIATGILLLLVDEVLFGGRGRDNFEKYAGEALGFIGRTLGWLVKQIIGKFQYSYHNIRAFLAGMRGDPFEEFLKTLPEKFQDQPNKFLGSFIAGAALYEAGLTVSFDLPVEVKLPFIDKVSEKIKEKLEGVDWWSIIFAAISLKLIGIPPLKVIIWGFRIGAWIASGLIRIFGFSLEIASALVGVALPPVLLAALIADLILGGNVIKALGDEIRSRATVFQGPIDAALIEFFAGLSAYINGFLGAEGKNAFMQRFKGDKIVAGYIADGLINPDIIESSFEKGMRGRGTLDRIFGGGDWQLNLSDWVFDSLFGENWETRFRQGLKDKYHSITDPIDAALTEFFGGLAAYISGFIGAEGEDAFLDRFTGGDKVADYIAKGLINPDIIKESYQKGMRGRGVLNALTDPTMPVQFNLSKIVWDAIFGENWATNFVKGIEDKFAELKGALILSLVKGLLNLILTIVAFWKGVQGAKWEDQATQDFLNVVAGLVGLSVDQLDVDQFKRSLAFGNTLGNLAQTINELLGGAVADATSDAGGGGTADMGVEIPLDVSLSQSGEDIGAGFLDGIIAGIESKTGIEKLKKAINGIWDVFSEVLGARDLPTTVIGRVFQAGMDIMVVLAEGVLSAVTTGKISLVLELAGLKMSLILLRTIVDTIASQLGPIGFLLGGKIADTIADFIANITGIEARIAELEQQIKGDQSTRPPTWHPPHRGLSTTPMFFTGAPAAAATAFAGPGIVVNVNNPVVDNQQRVRDMADEIDRIVGQKARLRNSMGVVH